MSKKYSYKPEISNEELEKLFAEFEDDYTYTIIPTTPTIRKTTKPANPQLEKLKKDTNSLLFEVNANKMLAESASEKRLSQKLHDIRRKTERGGKIKKKHFTEKRKKQKKH